MSVDDREANIRALVAALPSASDAILAWMTHVIESMARPAVYARLPDSNFVDEPFLQDFGDTLRLHHCFSREPFTKDKFEYALEWIANRHGRGASLSTRGNPGHDITIAGERISLKTQADKTIRDDEIHISKFKELGKGAWGEDVRDLDGLHAQFIAHLAAYDRIFTLRRLKRHAPQQHYELVEIPKSLFLRAQGVACTFDADSRQRPRPGYCRVVDENGIALFELYFDGGGERKLQVRHIRKSACVVHATWIFDLSLSA